MSKTILQSVSNAKFNFLIFLFFILSIVSMKRVLSSNLLESQPIQVNASCELLCDTVVHCLEEKKLVLGSVSFPELSSGCKLKCHKFQNHVESCMQKETLGSCSKMESCIQTSISKSIPN